MKDLGEVTTSANHPTGLRPLFEPDTYTAKEAEMEVEESNKEGMDVDGPERSSGGETPRRISGGTPMDIEETSSTHGGHDPATPSQPKIQPARRRSGPPGSIPNFPGNMTPREPPAFFNSPTTSPPAVRPSSPMSSSPPSRSGLRMPSQPFMMTPAGSGGAGAPTSPWLQLAASSGAPTPSLESGPGRSSPHLGYPFERLNIGGSWSGANLWGEGASQPQPVSEQRRSSVGSPGAPSVPNSDTLARYRMMAGRASASGQGKVAADSGSASANQPSQASTSSASRPALPPSLAKRRASLPKNVLGGLGVLSPPHVTGPKAPSPLASSSTKPTGGLRPFSADALPSLINQNSTLILDLRPPSQYQSSHIPTSHSIPVPSTLLRRPAFNLAKLAQMLSLEGNEAVSHWRDKTDIVLVDADSTSVPGGSIMEGVAAKFEREGYSGNMWFIKGGLAAVISSRSVRLAAANEAAVSEDHTGKEDPRNEMNFGNLGKLAFSSESTGSNLQRRSSSHAVPQTPGLGINSDPFASMPSTAGRTERPSFASRQSRDRTTSEASSGDDSKSLTASQKAKMQPANPFFDNIRQNLELSHGGGHERINLDLTPGTASRADDLPVWLSELATLPKADSAERLAEEFYRLERGEQKRLQAVMDWHSKSSGAVVMHATEGQREQDAKWTAKMSSWFSGEEAGDDYFPYSITAGVERGTKNRYKNIWPYDYSRVRLQSPDDDDGDYINASFIQPRGTARRYIATQGPLDATYQDFWTLVWEQRVSVIVMLTKQYEGGSIKCGNYWQDERYGPLRIHLESQSGGEDTKPEGTGGFDFGFEAESEKKKEGNIHRVFILTREDRPDAQPRKVVQIQCTSWPDFDVPETPDILLDLMRDVDEASRQTCMAEDVEDRAEHPPVLVHCSAGVGRTGTYIIVDAIMDALRRERQMAIEDDSSRDRSTSAPPVSADHTMHGAGLPRLETSKPVQSILVSRDGSADSENRPSSSGGGSPIGSGAGSAAESGSNDSSKSVSFLIPPASGDSNPASTDSLPTVFTGSPSPFAGASKISMSSSPDNQSVPPPVPAPAGKSPMTEAVPQLEREAEKMDVDPPASKSGESGRSGGSGESGSGSMSDETTKPEESEDAKRKTMFDNLFKKHRGGSSVASADSGTTDGRRRPSLATSFYGSSGPLNEGNEGETNQSYDSGLYKDIGLPAPITKSAERHRTPSPVTDSEGLSPVAVVLEGMRMQRMSLVQSLRQYLFVHRAIIRSYLNMVDEDRRQGRDVSIPHAGSKTAEQSSTSVNTLTSTSTATSTDEEGPSKRRASPTELMPERDNASKEASSSSLAKRPSFKKMRPAGGVEVLAPSSSEEEKSSSTSTERPKRHSKLGQEDKGK